MSHRKRWSYSGTELDQQYLQGDQLFISGSVVFTIIAISIFTYLFFS